VAGFASLGVFLIPSLSEVFLRGSSKYEFLVAVAANQNFWLVPWHNNFLLEKPDGW